MTRVNANAASSRGRDEHAGIVRNVILSKGDTILPATVTNKKTRTGHGRRLAERAKKEKWFVDYELVNGAEKRSWRECLPGCSRE